MKLSEISPYAAAFKAYKDGQGLESNPFPYETKDHEIFNDEMCKYLHQEKLNQQLQDLAGV